MSAVLLDLDGTLVDPAKGIFACIRYALARCGVDEPDERDLRGWIGPPLHESFGAFLGDTDLAVTALAHYRERYRDGFIYENTLYPGMRELLHSLHGAGFELFIATSKPRVFAEPIIERHGLAGVFTEICGSELDGTRADKTSLIAWICERHQLEPQSATMIGDRQFDIIGAKQNGLRALGVTYGYGTAAELRAAGAEALCSNPSALWSLLR